MTKKLSAILLSVLMIAVFVPVMSWAETAQATGGIDFTDMSTHIQTGVYYGTRVNDTYQVILEGDIINEGVYANYGIKVPDNTKILIRKDSSITAPNSADSYAILAEGDLTIVRETGAQGKKLSLTASEANTNKESVGIKCSSSDGTLKIDSDIEVDSEIEPITVDIDTTETIDNFRGIDGFYSVSINHTNLNINKNASASQLASAFGIVAGNGGVTVNESTVSVNTNNTSGNNYGIHTGKISTQDSKLNINTGDVTTSSDSVESSAIYATIGSMDYACSFKNSEVTANAGKFTQGEGNISTSDVLGGIISNSGIYAEKSTINAKAGDTNKKCQEVVGIAAEGYLHLNDSTANAVAGCQTNDTSGDSAAIMAGSISAESSILNATAGSSSNASKHNCYGVYSLGDAYFNDSKVDITSGKADKSSIALYTEGVYDGGPDDIAKVWINNSELSADAGEAVDYSAGISMERWYWDDDDNTLLIDNSKVYASASKVSDSGSSYGIHTEEGNILTVDSDVVANSKEGHYSCGMWAEMDVDWGNNNGNIIFLDSNIETNATGGSDCYESDGIYADGFISTNHPSIALSYMPNMTLSDISSSREGTAITADASCCSGNSFAVYADSYIDMYETKLALSSHLDDVNDDENQAVGLQSDASENQAISLHDCYGSIKVSGETSYSYGIYAHLNYSKQKIDITNCNIDVEVINEWADDGAEAYGIDAYDGEILITNGSRSNSVNVTADAKGYVECVSGAEVKIKGTGKTNIETKGKYIYGIYASDKAVIDTANVNIYAEGYDSMSEAYGIYAAEDNVDIREGSNVDIKVDNAKEMAGIHAASDATISDSDVNVVVDMPGHLNSAKSPQGMLQANLGSYPTLSIAINGEESVNIKKANVETSSIFGIVAGTSYDVMVFMDGNEISGNADLLIKDGSVSCDGFMISTGNVSIQPKAEVYVGGAILAHDTITAGDENNVAYFKNAAYSDNNEEPVEIYEASGNVPCMSSDAGKMTMLGSYKGDSGMWIAFHPFYDYKVEFNVGEHSTNTYETLYVNSGDSITKPDDPSANGCYVFTGWFDNENCTPPAWDFNYPVQEDMTLYAGWRPYNITFEYIRGDITKAENPASGDGTVDKPDNPTCSGYTFGGWFKNIDCADDQQWNFAIDKATGDMTLYAKWTKNQDPTPTPVPSPSPSPSPSTDTYTVSFNANGHGSAPASQSVNAGEKVVEPKDPSATGWIFGGWYTDVACTAKYNFSSAVNANITLYAKWTQVVAAEDFAIGISTTSKGEINDPTIKVDGVALELGKDYTVSIDKDNNKIVIKGIGEYASLSKTITIKKAPTKMNVASAYVKTTAGQVKVKWNKQEGVDGYQVKVARDTKFKKGLKSYSTKTGNSSARTFKELKSGKKYYTKLRAFIKVAEDNQPVIKIFGPWSKVKTIGTVK